MYTWSLWAAGTALAKWASDCAVVCEKALTRLYGMLRTALAKGLLVVNGKTPGNSMASALYTDLKRKEHGGSVFWR